MSSTEKGWTQERGYHALVQVIYELKNDGSYSDDEGEETEAMVDLVLRMEEADALRTPATAAAQESAEAGDFRLTPSARGESQRQYLDRLAATSTTPADDVMAPSAQQMFELLAVQEGELQDLFKKHAPDMDGNLVMRVERLLSTSPAAVKAGPVCYLRAKTSSLVWNSYQPCPPDDANAFPVYRDLQPPTAEPGQPSSAVVAPLTTKEIADLTAMVWGAPCADDELKKVELIIRAYEALKPGERPKDPVDGGRFLDVPGAFGED